MSTPEQHLALHRSAGRTFRAGRLGSFVREEGEGAAVLCVHGVPASSYLYRKVLAELAVRGMRGIAVDLPGLGLADRPPDFDYTFTGLGRWLVEAVDALGLDRFHLVVHDIGGPVGLELTAVQPGRLLSLTVLNTVIAGLAGFRKPWVMRPFESPLAGRLYLSTLNRFLFTRLMYLQGVADRSLCPPAEAAVYVDLLKMADGGAAFLKIMQRFEATREKEDLYVRTIRELRVPVQIIWGELDAALPVGNYGRAVQRATGVETLHLVPGKHFVQEDQAPLIAGLVAAQAGH